MSTVPRSRNPTYLIIAGAIVSILGALLVIVLVSSPGKISSVVPGATRGVLVSAREIGAHAQVTADDLKLVQYPSDLVPDRTFNSIDQATGRFTVTTIPKGQPITQDLVVATAQASVSAALAVPPGEVAVVIPGSDARNQVAALVQNGDHVDILAHNLPGQTAGQVATTFTDLPIQVLSGGAVGEQWIVYLPLGRAEQLTYLLLNGQYSFVVRARKDAPETAAPAVGRGEFNSTFGIH